MLSGRGGLLRGPRGPVPMGSETERDWCVVLGAVPLSNGAFGRPGSGNSWTSTSPRDRARPLGGSGGGGAPCRRVKGASSSRTRCGCCEAGSVSHGVSDPRTPGSETEARAEVVCVGFNGSPRGAAPSRAETQLGANPSVACHERQAAEIRQLELQEEPGISVGRRSALR